MRSSRLWPVLVLLLLVTAGVSAHAAEPTAAPADPEADAQIARLFLPLSTAVETVAFCPTYFCPIYDDFCSCEWITCPNGTVHCGVWNGKPGMSSASTPEMPRF